MGVTELLLTAITAISSALGYAVKLLVQKANATEKAVVELRLAYEKCVRELGEAEGRLEAVNHCTRAGCPLRKHENAS